jgi:FMN phosphatase YigB (HAD superfamily)
VKIPLLLIAYNTFKLLANAGAAAEKALRRDGIYQLFSVIILSEAIGIEKPNEEIFRRAPVRAGVSADRVVQVGNRLDSDVRPARVQD